MQKNYSTRRLLLRRLSLADYKTWVRSQEKALPTLNKYDVPPLSHHKRTYSLFKRNVHRHAMLARQDRAYIWNIFLKSTGDLVGWIDISTICRDPYQTANFGYYIINIYRRRGYGQEAARKIIKGSFVDLKFHRLEAVTDLGNRPAMALALASGFKKEGIKKYYWLQNGRWSDQMVFVATPEMFY